LLTKEKVPEEDIVVGACYVPVIKYLNPHTSHESYYFPDIYIKSLNLIIEVKSAYTLGLDVEKNKAKFQACVAQGFRFQVHVCYKQKPEPAIDCYEFFPSVFGLVVDAPLRLKSE
jgi:hypothetical protein